MNADLMESVKKEIGLRGQGQERNRAERTRETV